MKISIHSVTCVISLSNERFSTKAENIVCRRYAHEAFENALIRPRIAIPDATADSNVLYVRISVLTMYLTLSIVTHFVKGTAVFLGDNVSTQCSAFWIAQQTWSVASLFGAALVHGQNETNVTEYWANLVTISKTFLGAGNRASPFRFGPFYSDTVYIYRQTTHRTWTDGATN